MTKKRIGFIGLGLMGSGMTSNLLSAGYSVIGYDIDESRVDHLIKKGGQKVDSPDQLPRMVDVIILSLPNSHVVNQVVEDSLKLLMLDLAQRVNANLILSNLHAQALRAEVAKGRGEWDNSDIISFYEDLQNK